MRIIIRTEESRPYKPLGCMYYVIQYMLRYVMLYIPKNWQKSGLSNAPGFVQIGLVTSEILAPSKILISPDVLRTLTLARPQSGPFWPVWGAHKIGKNRINIRKIQRLSWNPFKAVGSETLSGGAREIAKKGNFREKYEKYQKNVHVSDIIKSTHTAYILMLKIIIKFGKFPKNTKNANIGPHTFLPLSPLIIGLL